MRLLNVNTRKFEEFFGDNIPLYAILSHRWGGDEVTYQVIKSGRLSAWRRLWSWPLKLEGCRLQAKKDNLSYIWIDTCCIDKTNAVELSEAINSMFNWYKNAARCYTYLSDVQSSNVPQATQSKFRASSWFTRGWTLQELLAPKELYFYDSKWELIGSKSDLSSTIEEVTKIPRPYLMGLVGIEEASVAQRMSWAANRVTTRTEDVAYCLLGLFDVIMPMIYGEKEQAFVRLQLEIIKNSDDHSILAWGFTSDQDTTNGDSQAIPGGALATSPANFANSNKVIGYKHQTTSSFESVGGSLRMRVPLFKNPGGQVFGLLDCGLESDKKNFVGIPLNAVPADGSTDDYFRPAGRRSTLFPRDRVQDSSLKLICIRRSVQASESKSVTRRKFFYIVEPTAMVQLIDVVPRNRWMENKGVITTSNDLGTVTREETFLRFRCAPDRGGDDFVVVLVFERQESLARATGHVMILSRHVPLAELAEEFKTIGQHLCGHQSCSNGQAGVIVSVKQENLTVFALKLTTLAEPSGLEMKTVNATQQLEKLRKQTKLVRIDFVLAEISGLEMKTVNATQQLEKLRKQSNFVIGIHFGSAYSSVSWAIKAEIDKIHLITDWPNPTDSYSNPNSEKVPTMISYEDESPTNWGYEAAVLGKASFRWFKILLDPDNKYMEQVRCKMPEEVGYEKVLKQVAYENEMLGMMRKSPNDVAADYLRMLWSHAQQHIQRYTGNDYKDIYSPKVVITVPAVWSLTAKERIKRAAKAAGLPGEVGLVNEHEAAAFALFRGNVGKVNNLEEGDVFVLCDAGELMADVISYKIKKSYPSGIDECAVGSRYLCGSKFVDMKFEQFVRMKVGNDQYSRINEKYRKRMMLDFDIQVKWNFDGTDKMRAIELRDVEDNPAEGIFDEFIQLSGSSVREMFDPVCSQVVTGVEYQIKEVEEKDLNVKAVFLTGGFGASKYLRLRLENARGIKDKGIQVIWDTEASSSMCRGATLWGLEYS